MRSRSSQDWFGGIYQDDRNQIAAFADRAPNVLRGVQRIQAAAGADEQAFLQDRTSAIVGQMLAERFGWKVGDTIPMRSNIWTRKDDGGNAWPMKIAGIYQATQRRQPEHLFPLRLPQRVAARSIGRDKIGWVVIEGRRIPTSAAEDRAQDRRDVRELLDRDQDLDREGVHPGLRQSDGQHRRRWSPRSPRAVFFTMLLVTANTMGQSIRERINEIARDEDARLLERGVTVLVLGEGAAGHGARRR